MIDINSNMMREYEIETRDSYVNCINSQEVI